jgi:hypothetical protein
MVASGIFPKNKAPDEPSCYICGAKKWRSQSPQHWAEQPGPVSIRQILYLNHFFHEKSKHISSRWHVDVGTWDIFTYRTNTNHHTYDDSHLYPPSHAKPSQP